MQQIPNQNPSPTPVPQPSSQNLPIAQPSQPKSRKKIIIFIIGISAVVGLIGGGLYLEKGEGGMFQGRFFRLPSVAPVVEQNLREVPVERGIERSVPVIPEVLETVKNPVNIYTGEAVLPKVVTAEPLVKVEDFAFNPNSNLQTLADSACYSDEDYVDMKTPMTRAHFAKMLVLAAGLESTKSDSFADITVATPCYEYIGALYANDIVEPYFGNVFRPNEKIERRDVAKWVVKAFDIPFIAKHGTSFPDVAPGSSYSAYIEALNNWNAVPLGKGETLFEPQEPAVYGWAQTVVQIVKFMDAFSRIR